MVYQRITIEIEHSADLTYKDIEEVEDDISEAVNDAIATLEERLPKLPKEAQWSIY